MQKWDFEGAHWGRIVGLMVGLGPEIWPSAHSGLGRWPEIQAHSWALKKSTHGYVGWVTSEDLSPMGGSGLPVGDPWAGGAEV
jgi:hypothetical protein